MKNKNHLKRKVKPEPTEAFKRLITFVEENLSPFPKTFDDFNKECKLNLKMMKKMMKKISETTE